MGEDNPELQAKLLQLDQELEEGDITRKGYEKRRTLLLAQYLGHDHLRSITALERLGTAQHPSALRVNSLNASSAAPPTNQWPVADRSSMLHQDLPAEGMLGIRNPSPSTSARNSYLQSDGAVSRDGSRTHSMARADYAFNPAEHEVYAAEDPVELEGQDDVGRMNTMQSQNGYFSDFTGQQMVDPPRESYGGPQRYSTTEAMSPNAVLAGALPAELPNAEAIRHQMPLEPRDVPFPIVDPHNKHIEMSKFDNIGAVLRHRGKANAKQPAYWVLDPRGKETSSITWEKLSSKAEKVAQVIREKSSLYRGDRVALVYRDTEIIDFAIALLGCFIAGVVAVPINCVDDYQKLSLLLTTTQAHLALTTENNLKTFHRDITTQKLRWPQGVEWWKTNEFGSYHPKKKDESAALQLPDLAYIEFSCAPTGDLRGVVLSHRTIMHQMACISAIVSAVPKRTSAMDTFNAALRDRNGQFLVGGSNSPSETILSYLDPREGVGMILGVLFGVYGGHTTVWMEAKTVDTAGLYAHLITRYRTTIMVADYSRLKFAAYNYQQDPMTTRNFKKGMEPNFSSVKLCLIDALTVDCEFHEILADRWFKPMRNDRARDVVAPMLCLPEHGGMIISVRDWLGGEERMGCPLSIPGETTEESEQGDARVANGVLNNYSGLLGGGGSASAKKPDHKESRYDLSEILLDKEALKTNEVIVLAQGEEAKRRGHETGTIRAGAFGYPIPDATLAVVDPETNLLCPEFTIGEIWVDSPSLSGGFWSLPKHTETIFHARPYRFDDGNPTPLLYDLEFLRTGLLGCVVEGKVYVLGLYEDRIRQKVEGIENQIPIFEHRYFFVQHLVSSIVKNIPKIHDCSAFDVYVNGEYLPIILIETLAASTAPLMPGSPPRQLDIPLLETLSERCMDVLFQEHRLRVYCVMITAPNTLPKVVKNGRKDIGNMLCRKEFDNGSLPCVHVQFGVERAVQNLPVGDDPFGGIWSLVSADSRMKLLAGQEKQYSGVDHREVVMDDRTSTPLNQFSNIQDLLQWRTARQSEELAYCTIDNRGREGKGINWKKLDIKIAAVAMYLRNKLKLQPGDHVVLMYTHSEEFVYAIHACMVLGIVAVPVAPLDQNRLNEDAPALLSIIGDFKIRALLVNTDVDQLLKQKTVSQHLRQSATILRVNVPLAYNTTKPPKQSHGCRELGLTIKPAWVQAGFPVLIWVYWTPDQRRVAVQLGHDTIMALCKVQKETCQMSSTRPVLACVRSTIGIGFLHMCVMGIYIAAPTYLVSPVDFAQNPVSLFLTLSRYKIKDTYATSQMLDHAMSHLAGKGFNLFELKNLMISSEGRPRVDLYQRVRVHFAQTGLDRTAINTIYSHVMNPMIASRSYMCVEPVEIWLDLQSLRRGLVVPVDPDTEPFGLLLQDSGMVPVSTQIAIVNPETNFLCQVGEYGEIWVQSEACGYSFYGTNDPLDAERFNGRTMDGDPAVRYVRTGDLGFLHTVNRPIGPGGQLVEMQVLFVLGNIGETFDVNGLNHFPMDIEHSIEKCHRNVAPNGCAVFQAGGLVVILVEVMRRNFLASMVPVIVNAVLNGHQVVADIVAFVSRGDFPRSRLGEKQRGKILASWVQRKMRTIAQFSIKQDQRAWPRALKSQEADRTSSGLRNGSTLGMSSVRPSEISPVAEIASPTSVYDPTATEDDSNNYEVRHPDHAPTMDTYMYEDEVHRGMGDDTPTGPSPHPDYEQSDFPSHAVELSAHPTVRYSHSHPHPIPRGAGEPAPIPELDSGPPATDHGYYTQESHVPELASMDGTGAFMTPPSLTHTAPGGQVSPPEQQHEWPQEAIMHMNLGSGGVGPEGQPRRSSEGWSPRAV